MKNVSVEEKIKILHDFINNMFGESIQGTIKLNNGHMTADVSMTEYVGGHSMNFGYLYDSRN